MDGQNPTTGDLRPGERVELVAIGTTVDLVQVGERGTVMQVYPMLMVVFDGGPIMGIFFDMGDEVRRVGS